MKRIPNGDAIDILLLCALKDEYDGVLSVTEGLTSEGWRESTSSNGRVIADGVFIALDGRPIKIRTTFSGYMGREQTQIVASSLLAEDDQVRCIAMSGICAGHRGKTELGDVIFADRMWSYDSGKTVVENGVEVFQGDMLQFNPSEVWVQHMQNLKVANDSPWLMEKPKLTLEQQEIWVLSQLHSDIRPTDHPDFDTECPDWTDVVWRLRKRKWIDQSLTLTESGMQHIVELLLLYPRGFALPSAFRVHVAPIATGATVKEDEHIFSKLSTSMRKVIGLDMEASALAAFACSKGVPIVVAKAVSDFGSTFKDDRYRSFAARASAECVILLLRQIRHLYCSDNDEDERNLKQASSSSESSKELIDTLAELFPDVEDVRGLWELAGGNIRDIENIRSPRLLWQNLWRRCNQGTSVTPKKLLDAALQMYPENKIIKRCCLK